MNVDDLEKKAQQAAPVISDVAPKACIEEQLIQLPGDMTKKTEAEATTDQGEKQPDDEWHHSIKVDQLALKLQSLSSDWADTKEQVHYQE